MDSQLSSGDSPSETISRLRECARRGDWSMVSELSQNLIRQPLPNRSELGDYLDQLRDALAVARATRADHALTLSRIRAATRFSHSQTIDR